MKLNKSCIRKVLLYLEEHCVYKKTNFGDSLIHQVTFHELIKAKELSKYNEDDIKYTIVKLLEGNYINGNLIPKNSGLNFNIANISELTLCGHDLLDNIRSEPVWRETKDILSKVGDFSLSVMSQVAGETMAAYTKSMMKLN